jgi:hypothetical protein
MASIYLTEQFGLAVTVQICIRDMLGSNLTLDSYCPERGFSLFSPIPESKFRNNTSIRQPFGHSTPNSLGLECDVITLNALNTISGQTGFRVIKLRRNMLM